MDLPTEHQDFYGTGLRKGEDWLLESVREVKRLFTEYSAEWSPIARSQISFYHDKLKSWLEFHLSAIPVKDDAVFNFEDISELHFLVNWILYEKKKIGGSANLTHVGDFLAAKMAEIALRLEVYDTPDFAAYFFFDREKFEQVFVGFEAETTDLLQQLASTTTKQLHVISIVGMAGLGKTTLATRLYNHPYVGSYFYVRAWFTCSQVYHKRDFLLGIIRTVSEITVEVFRMDDIALAHYLYRALKGKRYLIVIDDIWSIKAWDDFKSYFPDDKNGSKIMLTTRIKDVALHAQSVGNPLCLRFLTEEESFDLFRRKAYITGDVFDHLTSVGKSIMRKCRGLPLAIVVIAGLLKGNLNMQWWAQVEESVSSYILTDFNQYMDTLALSYNHLPQHLRPCFLSFGAFTEDRDIPVRKLIWLWIAEGFIIHDEDETENNSEDDTEKSLEDVAEDDIEKSLEDVAEDDIEKSLEDVAEDYLMDLTRRSLVVVGKKGSSGAIKTCRIHDLLRDLCIRKAVEENFSTDIHWYNNHSYICSHSLANTTSKHLLLLNTNDVLAISSNCSCYSSEVSHLFFKDVSIVCTSKLIRILDISSIELFVFPIEILQLVQLRYLELRFRSGNPPECISDLIELQTLVMSSRKNMVVPNNMWKMINLMHIWIRSGENLVNFSNVEEKPLLLKNLLTMSLVSPTRSCELVLARTCNLKMLGLCGPFGTDSGDIKFPDLALLKRLEKLKVLNTIPLCKAGRLSDPIIFPKTLKNLSLSNTTLDWKETRIFKMIPNLEVLKLKFHAFVGKDWETSAGLFPRLKFLKLDELDVVTWTVAHNKFPVLQRLQVNRCPYLIEIPKDFGNIYTLESIELRSCSDAATNSARDIQEEQESNGNDWLKILINPGPTPS